MRREPSRRGERQGEDEPHLEELSDLVLLRPALQEPLRVELVAQAEGVDLALQFGRHGRRGQVEPLRAGRVRLFLEGVKGGGLSVRGPDHVKMVHKEHSNRALVGMT